MKTIFTKKMGILMTLIFSFLFSLIVIPTDIKALEAGELYEQHATISNISLNNHLLSFDVENSSDVDVIEVSDFTYKFTYFIEDTLVGELKQADDTFTRDGSKYVISLDEKVVGVTLYKVRFRTSTSFITLDTNGTNSVGDCENTIKLNWVQLDQGKIISTYSDKIYLGSDIGNVKYVYSAFYFNFTDLIVDDVIDIDLRYYEYENIYKEWINGWFNAKSSENTDPIEKKYEVESSEAVYQGWENENIITQLKCLYGNCSDTYKKYAIEKSDNDNYQWKINLPTDTIKYYSENFWYTEIRTPIIEQADITTISYVIEGKEFIDIPVYQESSGFVYMPTYSPSIPWWVWLIVIAIALSLLAIIITLIKPIFIGIKYVAIGVWYVLVALYYILKWTIFLPITLIVRKTKKKEDDDVW